MSSNNPGEEVDPSEGGLDKGTSNEVSAQVDPSEGQVDPSEGPQ